MPSTQRGHDDYECPICFNNAIRCGCDPVKKSTVELLCGPLTKDSVRLAISIALGAVTAPEPRPQMLVVKADTLRTPAGYGLAKGATEFPYIGSVCRYKNVQVPSAKIPQTDVLSAEFIGDENSNTENWLLPCILESSDQERINEWFGINHLEIGEILIASEAIKDFKRRNPGHDKA
jgi:hypothetical protein